MHEFELLDSGFSTILHLESKYATWGRWLVWNRVFEDKYMLNVQDRKSLIFRILKFHSIS